MCEALTFLLDNIYIRFGSKLYRPMSTNCAPLVADLFFIFLVCYERFNWISFWGFSYLLFMLSISDANQSEVIKAVNSTSRYLDDLLNIDNNFSDQFLNLNVMVTWCKYSEKLLVNMVFLIISRR